MKFYQDYVRNLPDAFCKEEDCNNAKLLGLHSGLVSQIRRDIEAVDSTNDLEQAYGKTLDLYGLALDQSRGLMNDTKYRYLLRTRIGANLVGGDYMSVMRHLVQMFNVNQTEVKLSDFEAVEGEQSCIVHLEKLPLHVLAGAGFTSKQAVQMIEMLLPVCVTVYADNFEGTLEFAKTHTEYDENAGFADDDQIFGGWLGLLFGEDGETPLPL